MLAKLTKKPLILCKMMQNHLFDSIFWEWKYRINFYFFKQYLLLPITVIGVFVIWVQVNFLNTLIVIKVSKKNSISNLLCVMFFFFIEGVKYTQRGGGGPSNLQPKDSKPWPTLKILRAFFAAITKTPPIFWIW